MTRAEQVEVRRAAFTAIVETAKFGYDYAIREAEKYYYVCECGHDVHWGDASYCCQCGKAIKDAAHSKFV